MSETEKFICGDCKGITTFRKGKRGSNFIESFLWTVLFFPGIFYSIWRRISVKKVCQYCGGNFILPLDLPYSQ